MGLENQFWIILFVSISPRSIEEGCEQSSISTTCCSLWPLIAFLPVPRFVPPSIHANAPGNLHSPISLVFDMAREGSKIKMNKKKLPFNIISIFIVRTIFFFHKINFTNLKHCANLFRWSIRICIKIKATAYVANIESISDKIQNPRLAEQELVVPGIIHLIGKYFNWNKL